MQKKKHTTCFHFEQTYTLEEFAQRLAMHYGYSKPRLLAKLEAIFDGEESAPYPPLQAMLSLADKTPLRR